MQCFSFNNNKKIKRKKVRKRNKGRQSILLHIASFTLFFSFSVVLVVQLLITIIIFDEDDF